MWTGYLADLPFGGSTAFVSLEKAIYDKSVDSAPKTWVDEREWYYFQRFGCDIPDDGRINFSNFKTFDANGTGFPDPNVAPFVKAMPADYDWDGDGVPDREDTLPTVRGYCADHFVRGVKDSDGDGFCDPGTIDFKKERFRVTSDHHFFGFFVRFDNNPEADECPYLFGDTTLNKGCPTIIKHSGSLSDGYE